LFEVAGSNPAPGTINFDPYPTPIHALRQAACGIALNYSLVGVDDDTFYQQLVDLTASGGFAFLQYA
jgi:hypothetical protein